MSFPRSVVSRVNLTLAWHVVQGRSNWISLRGIIDEMRDMGVLSKAQADQSAVEVNECEDFHKVPSCISTSL